MTDESPFRERPKFMLCPRCGEMLEYAFDGVLTCLRCAGMWIAKVTVEKAFGDPRWPAGPSRWWRNELECPECALEGATSVMTAATSGDVDLDRCPAHGLWLDRTELGRLMGLTAEALAAGGEWQDLAALREQLAATGVEREQILRRRDAWRTDLELRRKAAFEYRAWLEAEHRRRTAGAERAARDEAARDEAPRDDAPRDDAPPEAERGAERDAEARREHERAVQRLGDARQEASSEVGRVEARIIMLREQLHAAEAELDGARVRLRAVEDQLAAVRAPPARV